MGKIKEMLHACKSIMSGEDVTNPSKEKAFIDFVRNAAADKGVTCLIVCETMGDVHIEYPSAIVKDVTEYYLKKIDDSSNNETNESNESGCTLNDLIEHIRFGGWQKDISRNKDSKWVKRHIVPNSPVIYWIQADEDFRTLNVYYQENHDDIVTLYGEVDFDSTRYYPVAKFTVIPWLDPITHVQSIKKVGIERFNNLYPLGWNPSDEEYSTVEMDITADVYDIPWENLIPEPKYGRDFIDEVIRYIKEELIKSINYRIRGGV